MEGRINAGTSANFQPSALTSYSQWLLNKENCNELWSSWKLIVTESEIVKNKKPITATLYCLLIYQLSKQLPWCTACSQWCNLLPSVSGNSFGSGPLPGLWCCNSCTTGYLHFQTEAGDLHLLIEHCLILGAGPNFGAPGKNELLFCFLFYDSTTHSYAAFHTVILQTLARSIASNHLFISSFPPSPCKFSIHSSGRPPGQVQHIFSSNWKNSQYGLHSLWKR